MKKILRPIKKLMKKIKLSLKAFGKKIASYKYIHYTLLGIGYSIVWIRFIFLTFYTPLKMFVKTIFVTLLHLLELVLDIWSSLFHLSTYKKIPLLFKGKTYKHLFKGFISVLIAPFLLFIDVIKGLWDLLEVKNIHTLFERDFYPNLYKKLLTYPYYKFNMKRREELYGLLFVSPFIIGAVTLIVKPIVQSVIFSFSEVQIKGLKTKFVGLKFYKYIFLTDPDFPTTLPEALGGMIYSVPIIIVFSLFVAVILNQRFKGRTLFRMLFFLPFVISSGVIMDILKNDMFSQSIQQGNENVYIFRSIGLQDILVNSGFPQSVVETIGNIVNQVFDLSWKIGVQALLFLAALQTIPTQLYEAAIIEGATSWEKFWKITFPIITPYIFVNLVYTIIDSFTDYNNAMMQLIDEQIDYTNGISIHSAMTWTYFTIIMIVLGIIYLLLRKRIVRLT